MTLIPIKTRVITPGDDIVEVILESLEKMGEKIKNNDILVLAETAVATAEGRIIKLSKIQPSSKAFELAKKYDVTPELAELILREADEILGGIPHVILTLKRGVLIANAGIDKSNAPPGCVVLLPKDPMKTAEEVRRRIFDKTGKRIGVIVADSRTQPLRLGTIGIALGVAGFVPVSDERGKLDIFGKPLMITRRAIADNLASAAEILMGEAGEMVPAVLIRGAPITFTDYTINLESMLISPEECLYMSIFKKFVKNRRTKYY
ncbi:MAG: coenzyme F420-0:L-glutamate ligase [Candidatus Baldrarchaeota archaeon]